MIILLVGAAALGAALGAALTGGGCESAADDGHMEDSRVTEGKETDQFHFGFAGGEFLEPKLHEHSTLETTIHHEGRNWLATAKAQSTRTWKTVITAVARTVAFIVRNRESILRMVEKFLKSCFPKHPVTKFVTALHHSGIATAKFA